MDTPTRARSGMAAELASAGFADAREVGRSRKTVVYSCYHTSLQRQVAVKVLAPDVEPDDRERFLHAGYAMGRLAGHPNIVTVLQLGVTPGNRPYIMMPYHSLGSLGLRLRQTGPIQWPETLRVGVKLAGALETAHRLETLHRDIKPGNVLITDGGEPQLTNFDVAHVAGGDEVATGFFTDAIAYTAPEVLAGSPPTAVADIYSLGATLYALITGGAARSAGEDLIAHFLHITSAPVPDMRPRGIPGDVCAAIEKAMLLDPASRQTSAVELGLELQAAQHRHGTEPDLMTLSGVADSGAAAGMPAVPEEAEPVGPELEAAVPDAEPPVLDVDAEPAVWDDLEPVASDVGETVVPDAEPDYAVPVPVPVPEPEPEPADDPEQAVPDLEPLLDDVEPTVSAPESAAADVEPAVPAPESAAADAEQGISADVSRDTYVSPRISPRERPEVTTETPVSDRSDSSGQDQQSDAPPNLAPPTSTATQPGTPRVAAWGREPLSRPMPSDTMPPVGTLLSPKGQRRNPMLIGAAVAAVLLVLGGVFAWQSLAPRDTSNDNEFATAPTTATATPAVWQPITSARIARTAAAATQVDGTIWIFGGIGADGVVSGRQEGYEPPTDAWRGGDDLPVPVLHASTVSWQGTPVVLGGWRSTPGVTRKSATDQVWRVVNGRWMELPPMLQPRAAGAAAVIGDRIIVTGGVDANGALLNTTEIFDGTSWSLGPELPTPRLLLGAASDDKLMYAVGGINEQSDSRSVEAYDPAANTWTVLPDLPLARSDLGVAIADGRLVAVGGTSAGQVLNSVTALDLLTLTWTDLPDMGTARHGMAVAAVADSVYAVGGSTEMHDRAVTSSAEALKLPIRQTQPA